MKISARNMLKGKVKKVTHGAVNSEVTVELPGGGEIVSIIIPEIRGRKFFTRRYIVWYITKALLQREVTAPERTRHSRQSGFLDASP